MIPVMKVSALPLCLCPHWGLLLCWASHSLLPQCTWVKNVFWSYNNSHCSCGNNTYLEASSPCRCHTAFCRYNCFFSALNIQRNSNYFTTKIWSRGLLRSWNWDPNWIGSGKFPSETDRTDSFFFFFYDTRSDLDPKCTRLRCTRESDPNWVVSVSVPNGSSR